MGKLRKIVNKATLTMDDRRLPNAIPVGSIDGSNLDPLRAMSGIIALRPGFGLAVLRVSIGLLDAIRKFEFLRRLLSRKFGSGAKEDPRRPILGPSCPGTCSIFSVYL